MEVNLPFYRSISNYMIGSSPDDSSAELTLGESIDWTMKNKQSIEVPIDKELFPKIKRINIIGKTDTIKSIALK